MPVLITTVAIMSLNSCLLSLFWFLSGLPKATKLKTAWEPVLTSLPVYLRAAIDQITNSV